MNMVHSADPRDETAHHHSPGEAHAHHHHHETTHRRLLWALLLTGGFGFVELGGGFWSGSLALISDAGHMFTDAGALLLALLASRISRRPVNQTKSYGYARAEVLGALVNSVLMLGLVLWIFVEAVQRLLHPAAVNGIGVMTIASIGLLVNLAAAWLLSHDHGNLNSRAAFIHVLGDLLGSAAAIVAGAVIYATGWQPIDPLLSMLVCVLILRSTWSLLRQSANVLMDSVPEHLDLNEIGHVLAAEEGVIEVHDLHIWRLGGDRIALSAHLTIEHPENWPVLLAHLNHLLKTRYGIGHTTLQPVWRMPAPVRTIAIHPLHH